jgi:hypothetical protein
MGKTGTDPEKRTAPRVEMRHRIGAFALLLTLYVLAVVLGAVSFPGYHNASGVVDLGHYLVPSLLESLGERRAEYVWWLGTLPLELFFAVIAVVVLVTGRGIRLAVCLYAMYALHWLVLHATTLPPPDHIVWRFPPGVFTMSKPYENDLWFSGHTANALVIALATRRLPRWMRAIAWSALAFEILLVLSARTHYTIDVIGGLFVGYATHRISLDLFPEPRSA